MPPCPRLPFPILRLRPLRLEAWDAYAPTLTRRGGGPRPEFNALTEPFPAGGVASLDVAWDSLPPPGCERSFTEPSQPPPSKSGIASRWLTTLGFNGRLSSAWCFPFRVGAGPSARARAPFASLRPRPPVGMFPVASNPSCCIRSVVTLVPSGSVPQKMMPAVATWRLSYENMRKYASVSPRPAYDVKKPYEGQLEHPGVAV